MRMIVPNPIDAAHITATNVPENDHPEWVSGGAYVRKDKVMISAVHQVFEAAKDNPTTNPSGNVDPKTGIGSEWFRVGPTNRHKPFDGFVAQVATLAGEMRYTLTPGTLCDGLALFGLNAASVQLIITDPDDGEVFNQTKSLISSVGITDWYEWFYAPEEMDAEILFADLPPYPAASFEIVVSNPGATVEVGQIILGRDYRLGTTTPKTGVSGEDFSTFLRDDFGRISDIQERPYISRVDYDFSIPSESSRRIQRLVMAQRARAAVFYTAPDKQGLGTLVFGKAKPLSVNFEGPMNAFVTLEVEGMT